MDDFGSVPGRDRPYQSSESTPRSDAGPAPALGESTEFGLGPGIAARTETAAGTGSLVGRPRESTSKASLAGPLFIYTMLRLALIVLLTAGLMFFMPLIVALLFAIIVQLPLSWLLFSGPRRRVNDAMAASSAQRRSERARLQSALAGDEPPADR